MIEKDKAKAYDEALKKQVLRIKMKIDILKQL